MNRQGFTLLEILVAFTILALALGVLLRAFSSGVRSLEAAEDYATAAMQVRSKMAEVGPVIVLEPGEHEGELENGSHWRVVVEPHEIGGESSDSVGPPLRAYRVEVTVSWRGGRAVTLNTLRLTQPKLE